MLATVKQRATAMKNSIQTDRFDKTLAPGQLTK